MTYMYMCALVFARGSIALRWFACTILNLNSTASMSTNYAFKLIIHVQDQKLKVAKRKMLSRVSKAFQCTYNL